MANFQTAAPDGKKKDKAITSNLENISFKHEGIIIIFFIK